MTECCAPDPAACHPKQRFDALLWGSLAIIAGAVLVYFFPFGPLWLTDFSVAIADLLSKMWWGILFGMLAVGIMQKVPREYFQALLGRGDTFSGVIRATVAGLLLDLCSHGILMIGAKLYERGASLAQVMAFLISSPWNSFSLTLILISLIGLKWTLVFIAGSMLIAVVTGYLYLILTRRGLLPENPHRQDMPDGFDIKKDARARLKNFRPGVKFFTDVLADGFKGGEMVLRWLFFGTIIAALIRTFVSTDIMLEHFGPTLGGLLLTLVATTIIEVCSEGSAPIGAELVNRAAAPGNGFTFLMAGVSTDYTEMLVIRQMTGSWKIALSLPLLTVPQVVLLGWIMNMAGG
jgi:uncharacterized membrane protein YraQ (UPF0718 family)